MGIEGREGDEEIEELVREAINSAESETAAAVERAFLRTVEGGCQVPLGCYAVVNGERVHIRAFISDLNGEFFHKEEGVFQVKSLKEADGLGVSMAERLLSAGPRPFPGPRPVGLDPDPGYRFHYLEPCRHALVDPSEKKTAEGLIP